VTGIDFRIRQLLTFHILGNNGNNSHWTRDNLQQMFTTISKCLIFYIIFLRSVCHYFTVGIVPGHCPYQIQICSTFLTIAQKCELLETVACKRRFSHFSKNSSTTFWETCFSQNGVLVNFTKKMAQDIYRITSCYNSMTQIAELDIFTGTGIKFGR